MNIIKNYQKNIKESKGKNKHNDYFEELKETSSPSKDYSLPFPFFKKIIEADILSPKLAISIKCPYKDCCVTFYVSKEDFNNCSMIICPKGHNICSKVLRIFIYIIFYIISVKIFLISLFLVKVEEIGMKIN